ncbi:MAG: DUF3261 domain-containing protein [Myxococcaceae bacterium]
MTAPRPAPRPEVLLKLSPASLGRELQLAQRITVVRDGDRKSFEAQLEVDRESVRIAAVAMGQTIATLAWDGAKFTHQVSTHVPEAITPDRILSDVQLAWWPADSIRAALPAGWTLADQGLHRSLAHDGVDVASIDYAGTAPAWAHVTLSRPGYQLDIESVELAP